MAPTTFFKHSDRRDSDSDCENLLTADEKFDYGLKMKTVTGHGRVRRYLFMIAILVGYTISVAKISSWSSFPHHEWSEPSTFYSPALVSVEEEVRNFWSRPDDTYFGPPTPERNAAWENICGTGNGIVQLKLNAAEQQLLPSSMPVPTEEEYKIYALSMCHQLHCLNRIRLSFHEGYFPDEDEKTRLFHRDHCIDHLRDNIMCKADVTLDYWQWDVGRNGSFLHVDTVHQCRNFKKIIEWSDENKLEQGKLPL